VLDRESRDLSFVDRVHRGGILPGPDLLLTLDRAALPLPRCCYSRALEKAAAAGELSHRTGLSGFLSCAPKAEIEKSISGFDDAEPLEIYTRLWEVVAGRDCPHGGRYGLSTHQIKWCQL
jgi:hypothetical protein